jgi:hypothetical protein
LELAAVPLLLLLMLTVKTPTHPDVLLATQDSTSTLSESALLEILPAPPSLPLETDLAPLAGPDTKCPERAALSQFPLLLLLLMLTVKTPPHPDVLLAPQGTTSTLSESAPLEILPAPHSLPSETDLAPLAGPDTKCPERAALSQLPLLIPTASLLAHQDALPALQDTM